MKRSRAVLNVFTIILISVIPRFLTQLSDLHVKEHESATFTCDVYPANSVLNWFVNGRKVKDDKKYRITSPNNQRQLVVKDVKEEDANIIMAALDDVTTEAILTVEG